MAMDQKLRQINRALKGHDKRLFAVRASTGVVHVLRQADKWEAADALDERLAESRLKPQYIMALTDNWTQTGNPVDWGIEPIMERIRSMDSWSRSEGILDGMIQKRQRQREDQKRALNNNLRARAADMRKDFARATNDIRFAGIS
jgi:hypothetical protein